jgi:pimeloyl-ACP methyl ester carboxylesterase
MIGFGRRGTGPGLVLVDGALSYRGSGPMAGVADALSSGFTVYTYDRRGRGESTDTAPHAVEREVEDLAAVIAAAGGSAYWCGRSSGAVLAPEAAASGLPITKLALHEPPLTVGGDDSQEDDEFSRRLVELISADRRGDPVEWFFTNAGVPAEAIAEMRGQPEWRSYEAIAPTLAYDNAVLGDGTVPRDRAARIAVPTLVANGAESPGFFDEAAEATTEAIPGAQHRVLEGQSWGQVEPKASPPYSRSSSARERPVVRSVNANAIAGRPGGLKEPAAVPSSALRSSSTSGSSYCLRRPGPADLLAERVKRSGRSRLRGRKPCECPSSCCSHWRWPLSPRRLPPPRAPAWTST